MYNIVFFLDYNIHLVNLGVNLFLNESFVMCCAERVYVFTAFSTSKTLIKYGVKFMSWKK